MNSSVIDGRATSPNSSTSTPELRILAIVPSAFCYGLQNLTLELFANLSPHVRPHFVNSRWSDGEFARRLDRLGIPYSATWLGMFSRRLDVRSLKMTVHCLSRLPFGWWHMARVYSRFRPHVVYLANHHEAILLWPLLVFWRRKVVCHMHDPSPAVRFQKVSFAVWRKAVGRFLFISKSVRERTAMLGGLAGSDEVVYNGIKITPIVLPRTRSDRFERQFGWPKEVVIVGMTGQMTETKGHLDFLKSARELVAEDPNVRFVIGGKPLEPYHQALQKTVVELGLTGRVGFCGWLESSTVFFEGVDVFVLASRHDEGFGLVVAEAMERALPVVATRSGGAVEIVDNGITGILVDKECPESMAKAIGSLVNDSPLRRRMGLAGRERAAVYFNLQTQVRQFETLLSSTPDVCSQ